ncbi:MAG: isoleucine--tRNA ligase, partial [Lachnospiraceae bacterium]|nr:isoleucine--tRNA ligase [Lachnospiraceae bacterium]
VKAADGYTYVMAQALLDSVLGAIERPEGTPAYEVLETCTGKDLEYKEYEPLYQCAADVVEKQHKKAFFVYCDDYVTMQDGTGIVHIAPAFGEDDARVGRKYDAPFVQMVDDHGVMKPETPFAGMRCKPTQKEIDAGAISCDPEVLKELSARKLLFSAPKVEHDYPHCWRCSTPLIYYARDSWYIRETAVRDDLVRNNATVNWVPETIGSGRFGNWLENIQDWAISRNRYWGTPLNIWECSCGHRECVGSREELAKLSGNPEAKTVELHRPFIDAITCKCPECGGTMKRVPEVIDCWFDSGAMPFAQHHYPFENKELFEKQFPAQFISEGVDQTRGWFHSLMAESTLLFNKAPYENVVVLGLVLDKDGQKMSKSKGNTVDPFESLAKHGADAIRWYFYTNSAPWLPNRFDDKAITEGQRKFMGTLWNTYAFFTLYANIDNFDPTNYSLDYDKLPVMDKWLLSKLNSVVKEVDQNLDTYHIPEAGRALDDFVDELSNWYVRRCRERFWAKGMEQDKINAYMTLYTALVTIAKAAAPMIPFMTEDIYRNLVCSVDASAPESVHLCDFPVCNEAYIDKELEENMDEVLNIVVIGRACRNEANIKQRQPLAKMYVKCNKALSEFYREIIEDELNVKTIEFKDDVASFTDYTFKPNFKTLGKRFGGKINTVKELLLGLNGVKAMEELKATGAVTVVLDGTPEKIEEADLAIESKKVEGFVTGEDHGITVVMDTNLTPELIEEGYVREVISKVQTMRKDADFEVMDHITLYVSGNEKIADIVKRNEDQIRKVVLATGVVYGSAEGSVKDWNLNGEDVTLGVKRE